MLISFRIVTNTSNFVSKYFAQQKPKILKNITRHSRFNFQIILKGLSISIVFKIQRTNAGTWLHFESEYTNPYTQNPFIQKNPSNPKRKLKFRKFEIWTLCYVQNENFNFKVAQTQNLGSRPIFSGTTSDRSIFSKILIEDTDTSIVGNPLF